MGGNWFNNHSFLLSLPAVGVGKTIFGLFHSSFFFLRLLKIAVLCECVSESAMLKVEEL